jgi:phosphoglycerol transferase MdoB-like AlkP superfamily enzyme
MYQLCKQNFFKYIKIFCNILIFSLFIFIKQILFQPNNLNKSKIILIAATSILLLLWTVLLSEKKQILILIIIDLLITIVILSDKIYYRYYSSPISISVLYQVGLVGSVFDSIKALIKLSDFIYIMDFFTLIPIICYIRFNRKKYLLKSASVKLNIKNRIYILAITCTIAFTVIGYKLYMIEKSNPGVLTSIFNNNYIENEMGIISFHIVDSLNYLYDNTFTKKRIVNEDINNINRYFDSKKNNLNNGLYGISKGKNIIIIQVESLQSFVINKKIYNQEITPNLNKIINQSMYFSNFYSQVAGGNTSDAEFLTNTSMYPAKNGAVYFKYPMNVYNSLPNILKKEGYYSAVLHGYFPEFWNRQIMYNALGFDRFYSNKDYIVDESLGLGITDKSFFNQSLDKLSNLPKPFYSFFITLTSHHPFNALGSNSSLDTKEYNNTLLGNYFKSINYADEAIGNFIDGLKNKGLYDNSIILIYGDHDAINFDHYNELGMYLQKDKNRVIIDEYKKVPFIIHIPNLAEGRTIEEVGGEIDILPTLLNLLGIDNKYYLGNDLSNSSNNMVIFRDGSFLDNKYRYISNENKVYNLSTSKSEDLMKFKEKINEVKNILKISDQIMTNNLFKKVLN